MNEEQNEVLDDILNTFEAVIEDNSTEYKHKVIEGKNEWFETVNREQHLQAMMQWAVQQLENNFELGEF